MYPHKYEGFEISDEYRLIIAPLIEHIHEPWDADDRMDVEWFSTNPIMLFIENIKNTCPENWIAILSHLCFNLATRALPCYELYSEGKKPRRTLDLAYRILNHFPFQEKIEEFFTPEKPFANGAEIIDCRACDTFCASTASAEALKFIATQNIHSALFCISSAEMALDQSPLGLQEDFRRWLIEIAIPNALENIDISYSDLNKYRNYDPEAIPGEKFKGK